MTWDALAEATGIGKATLLKMSKGDSRLIRLEHLDALCTFFGLASFDKLMEPQIIALPLQVDPVMQERARKAAATRWEDD